MGAPFLKADLRVSSTRFLTLKTFVNVFYSTTVLPATSKFSPCSKPFLGHQYQGVGSQLENEDSSAGHSSKGSGICEQGVILAAAA